MIGISLYHFLMYLFVYDLCILFTGKTTKETKNEEKYPSRILVVRYYGIFNNIRCALFWNFRLKPQTYNILVF